MMCTILLAYVMMTICILIWYTILLIHEMIIIKYCVAIVIVFLMGYHIIFVLYFLGVTMKCYYWMFIHLIIIIRGFKSHRLFIFSNFSWLVMCLGFIGSLLTGLTHSLYIGHWQHIKIRAHSCSG